MKTSKAILPVLTIAAVVTGFLFLPLREWFVYFETYVKSLGALGPVLVALAYVLCTIALVPASALTIGSGTIFGLKMGFIVVIAGANLGALCSFLLARSFLREKVAFWAATHAKFRALDQAIGKQGFKMVLLARLTPVFPFVLLNYFLGLTAVRTGAYILANLIGMLPAMFLFVYIGAAARDALARDTADFYQQVFQYVGLAATIALLVVITRIARKALREAEQAEEGSIVLGKPRPDAHYEPMRFEKMILTGDNHDQRLLGNCHPPGRVNPTPSGKYNLVVLGGGTAGLVSAAGAAALGAKVALVERNLMGGDCLNVGCVPSKGMISASRAAHEARSGAQFGVSLAEEPKIDFAAAMERMRKLRADISEHDSVARFTNLGVDVFIGNGRFLGSNAIAVDGVKLQFGRAVIATGARAAVPELPGLNETGFYTNETIFTVTELPRRMVVIGAGPMGCELAQSFRRFGSEVSLLTHGGGILPKEDRDAAVIVRRQMEQDGVRIITGAALEWVTTTAIGKKLHFSVDDRKLQIACDAILVCIGRTPNLENLGLEEAGVRYTARGVEVDARLRTTNPRIFGAGDICSRFKFTHAADAMARIVIANALFMARRKVTDLVIPWCTYTDPEIAHVGYHEKDAQVAGFAVATITQPLHDVDRAILDGEDDGFARVHYDKKTAKILGGTIVARHAGEMIGELTVALAAKQTVGVLSSTVHPYPTQAEVLRKIGDAYMRTKLTPLVRKLFARWLAWRR